MSVERAPSARAALEGEYEILRELGIGGTAIVYLARKRSTGAEVAIKLIRAAYLEDEEALARFAREARYASRLDHPNVVPIREVLPLGGGGVALIMPHVAGKTLKQLVRDEGRLSPERAEHVLRDVAAGLTAAHAMDIIHRDVKPENIFIDESGDALLADFGLARSTSTGDTQLTMTGVAIGTPTYMPPEQIDGSSVDARGDVYSLGLVTWEMLTGKRPWDGDSLYALLYHQKHDYLPDVREFRPDISDRFADVIATAIEKDPDSRWQSISEMIAALDGVIPSRRAVVQPVSSDTVRVPRAAIAKETSPATASPGTASPAAALVPAAAPVQPWSASSTTASARPVTDFATLHAIATELESERSRRRFLVPVLALVAVLAVASAAVGWRWYNARRAEGRASGLRPIAAAASTGTTDSMMNSATSTSASPNAAAPAVAAASPTHGASDTAAGSPESARLRRARDSAALALTRADSAAAAALRQGDVRRPGVLSPILPGARGAAAGSRAGRVAAPPSTVATPSVPVATPASVAPPAPPSAPVTVPPSRATMAAGGMHTCLIGAEGRGYCWGANARGQLGTSSSAGARVVAPTPIGGDLDLLAVAAGLSHSCGIVRGGAVWCWGENDHGQLGDRSNVSRSSPVRVADGHVFRTVTAGASHTCALDADGIAWCWGANNHGQLGTGGAGDASAPTAIANWHFTMLTAGWNFTCGLDGAGRAFCWGENDAGQLGTGDAVDRGQPSLVTSELAFTAIAAGASHACGITAQGAAYCWGRNTNGQLGDGTTTNHAAPTQVRAAGVSFTSITAGAMHSCAIDTDGQARCWGLGSYGQLGDGGTGRQLQPVLVSGNHRFATLRAFGSHTCGTTTSGEAFCWGYNLEGQLGDGTRTNRSRPVYLEPPTGK